MTHLTTTHPFEVLLEKNDGNWHAAAMEAIDRKISVPRPKAMFFALLELRSTIEITGGLSLSGGGVVGDPEWSDLAEAYTSACHALGAKPLQEAEDGR